MIQKMTDFPKSFCPHISLFSDPNSGSPWAICGRGKKFLLDKLYHKLIYFDD